MHEPGFLKTPGLDADSQAFLDANTNECFTRAQLTGRVLAFAGRLPFRRKALGFLFPFNDSAGLIAYLAALESGHAIVMLNPELDPALKTNLIVRFQPDYIVTPASHPPAAMPEYDLSESPEANQI